MDKLIYVDSIKLERNRKLEVYKNPDTNEFDFEIITEVDEKGVGQFTKKNDLIANLQPYMYESDMESLMRSRKFKKILAQMKIQENFGTNELKKAYFIKTNK